MDVTGIGASVELDILLMLVVGAGLLIVGGLARVLPRRGLVPQSPEIPPSRGAGAC